MASTAERFTPEAELLPAEVELIRCVERGEDFEWRKGLDRIRGGLIRAIMLRTRLRHHPSNWIVSPPRAVWVTPHGIRIRPAADAVGTGARLLVQGQIDLRDISPRARLTAPPLHFVSCDFDAVIELCGARLQSLSLEDCTFSMLRGQGTHFASSVRLVRCAARDRSKAGDLGGYDVIGAVGDDGKLTLTHQPSQLGPVAIDPAPAAVGIEGDCPEPARCEVFLRAASIGGGLEIAYCSLQAARLVPSGGTRSMRDHSALELSHARIRDRVELIRSTFVGGARLVSTEVGDDIWIIGGKFLTLASRYAIDLQFAEIKGQLALKADDEPDVHGVRQAAFSPVLVVGQVSALGMTAGEVWISGGYFHGLDDGDSGASPTLNFAKVNIARTFKLGLYHPHYWHRPKRAGDRVYVRGELSLVAADLGKNLEVHGAHPTPSANDLCLDGLYDPIIGDRETSAVFKIVAEAIKVDRRINITHSHFRACSPKARPPVRTTAYSGEGSAARPAAALDLFKATIGTGIEMHESCTCEGAIRLNNCLIAREAIFTCETIKPAPGEEDCGRIPWLLDMRASTIGGHLRIGSMADRAPSVTICGGITLESAKVSGTAVLSKVRFDLRAIKRAKMAAGSSSDLPERKRIALHLRDLVCGSDFGVMEVEWQLPSREAAAVHNLPVIGRAIDWVTQRRWFVRITDGDHVDVDMRGFTCTLLSDGFGGGWGFEHGIRLRLAGIRIAETEIGGDEHARDRLRWLSYQYAKQPVLSRHAEKITFPERFYCARASDFIPHAYRVFARATSRAGEDHTAEWLLTERKNVGSALRVRRVARAIWTRPYLGAPLVFWCAIVAAISAGAAVYDNLGRSGFIYFLASAAVGIFGAWPLILGAFQTAFRYSFRYGLSHERALLVLVCCIGFGWGGVHYARNGEFKSTHQWETKVHNGELDPRIALVLDSSYMPAPPTTREAEAIENPAGAPASARRGAFTRFETRLVYAQPSPCNLDVSSLLYAIDVFVPVLDLDQERRCSIRDANGENGDDTYKWWRLAKALYELLGWIVTSLVILTVTGVLRRDIEPAADAPELEAPGA